MSTPKIPKQFRITLKQQFDHEYHDDGTHTKTESPPLGFANVYDPHTKAYAKRKETQDNWAYGSGWNAGQQSCQEIDGQFWTTTGSWELKQGLPDDAKRTSDNCEFVRVTAVVPPQFQPIIIDNEPIEGFRIQHMVARYRGNKLWRILDPRGFELEIGSGNFEDLVMSGVVDRGLIVGKCVWKTAKMLERV